MKSEEQGAKKKRARPDFKYTVEYDNGSMTLVADGKRSQIVEVDGGFALKDGSAFSVHPSITDIYTDLRFERQPTTPTTSHRFNLRKNLLDLSANELEDFAFAMNCLYSAGTIQKLGDVHNNAALKLHWCPQFLAWHRFFLLTVEQEMRKYVPDITLPYWDWTDDRSSTFESELLGNFFGGREKSSGPFSHWDTYTRWPTDPPPISLFRPTLGGVVSAIRRPTFSQFRAIESQSIHTWAHEWVGGLGENRVTMARMNSPHDPLFYVHHTMIDRIGRCGV